MIFAGLYFFLSLGCKQIMTDMLGPGFSNSWDAIKASLATRQHDSCEYWEGYELIRIYTNDWFSSGDRINYLATGPVRKMVGTCLLLISSGIFFASQYLSMCCPSIFGAVDEGTVQFYVLVWMAALREDSLRRSPRDHRHFKPLNQQATHSHFTSFYPIKHP